MRADLPEAVRRAVAAAPEGEAQLLFDEGTLARTFAELAAAGRAARITVLVAAKALPMPRALALAAEHLGGFDLASPGEHAAVAPLLGPRHVISFADPSLRALSAAPALAQPLVSCEDKAALALALAAHPRAEPAARLSSSLTGRDPALGAVPSGQGHFRSRFGIDATREHRAHALAELGAMAELAHHHRRPLGLHVHATDLAAPSATRVLETAHAALALAAEAGLAPAYLNLGGGWHGAADLAATWAALRRDLPPELPLFVEPGRVLTRDSGFAIGRVCAARHLADRELRVITLSRACHLRWSQLELVARAPRPGFGRKILFAGPTCYEDDVLGEWTVDEDEPFAPGAVVVFRNVTGYAAAWNTGFAGIAPALVRVVA